MKKTLIMKKIKLPNGIVFTAILPRKALCVKQPWANLIAAGIKKLEVRSWQTKYRGPLTIVASVKPAFSKKKMRRLEQSTGQAFLNGVAIGVVNLVSVHAAKAGYSKLAMTKLKHGDFVWLLDDARFAPINMPVKGRLGVFDL